MEVAGVEPGGARPSSRSASGSAPRINAAGRMQRADAALELLLTEDDARAAEVARELDLLNRDRREAETRILFAAEAACAPQASQGAIVVAGEDWHPGVVGIVASRLVERWRRPCVVIALDGEGGGRGSGRSISAYDLHAGLAACSEHLTRFGGHRMAAGVELDAAAVEPFRARAGRATPPPRCRPDDLIPVRARRRRGAGRRARARRSPRSSSGCARSGWATRSRRCWCPPRASSDVTGDGRGAASTRASRS